MILFFYIKLLITQNMDTQSTSSHLPKRNIGEMQRGASLLTGSILILDGLLKDKKNIPETLLGAFLVFRGATGYCPATHLATRSKNLHGDFISIQTTLTINRPRYDVYTFWKKLENLPLFMQHLQSVKQINETESEWTA